MTNEYLSLVNPVEGATAAPKPANEYLDLVQDDTDRRRQALAGSLNLSVGTNPDQYSAKRKVAGYLGYPTAAVEALPKLADQAKVQQVQDDTANSPVLQRKYSDEDFAKLAHDDSGVLSAIGNAMRYLGSSAHSGTLALTGAAAKLANEAASLAGFTLTDAEAATIFKNDPVGFKRWQEGAPGFLSRLAKSQQAGSEDVMANLSPGAKETYGNLRYSTLAEGESAWRSPVKIVGDAIQSLPTTLALILSAKFSKDAAGAAYKSSIEAGLAPELARASAIEAASRAMARAGAISEGGVGYAQQSLQTASEAEKTPDATLAKSEPYQMLLKQGFAPATAKALVVANAAEQAGQIAGIVDAAVNFAGGKVLGKVIGEGGGFFKSFGKGAATEAVTEGIQSPGEQFGQNWAQKLNTNPGQDLSDGVLESALQGVAVGGLTGGAFGSLASRAAHREEMASKAETAAQHMQEQLQTAMQSKLRERSPDEFRAAVQAMADGTEGAPRSVFIDAEQFAQLPQEVLQSLPGAVLDQMQTALASNDTVEIPVGDILAIAPGTPLEQMVVEHGRLGDPMMPSQAEAKQAGEQAQQWLATSSAATIQQAQDSQAMQASSDAVSKTIFDQLQATGRFRQAVNEGYATWAAAFYTTMAGRLGMTPEEMHAKYPLRIVGETGQGATLDQPGTLADVRRQWTDAGIENYIAEKDGTIDLSQIIVPKAKRGQGIGSAAMKALTDYADRTGQRITLTPDKAYGASSVGRLVQFYKTHGFVQNKGRNRDFSTTAGMIREPVAQTLNQATSQTDTPAFRAWFGDWQDPRVFTSKWPKGKAPVSEVMADGKPLVVYHATNGDFSQFETGRPTVNSTTFGDDVTERHAIFATADAKFAEDFLRSGTGKNVMPLFMNIKQVADLREGIPGEVIEEIVKNSDLRRNDFYYIKATDTWSIFDGDFGKQIVAALQAAGYDGALIYENGHTTDKSHDVWVAFKAEQVKSATGNNGAFDPNDPSILKQSAQTDGPAGPSGMARDVSGSFTGAAAPDPGKPTPRGTFNPQSLELALNKNADLTSFFHETGHFFLEVMADIASQPNAPAEIAQDMGTVLAWFGVPSIESWQAMTLNEQRPYHERFAESIEQYIMEGNAPSVELQPLFRKFRAWVLNVYRSAKAFIDGRTGATEIQLSDEVRKVFDRMLASQEQIKQAEEVAGMMPNQDATAEAVEKLTARSMRDLAWTVKAVANAVRGLNKEAATMRREVRIEARAEIMQQPVYQAWRFLTGKGDAVDRANPPPKNETNGLDVTKDSLTVAIAKLGGINRESARRDAGVHPDYHRTESGVFGKPVFRKEGGLSADSMAEALAEAHYLPVDENGKHSLHDLEDALADELGGSPRYSLWYDRAQSMGEQGSAALPENVNVGKLSTEALREMFGTGTDALWRKLSALGMTSDTVGLSPDVVADAFGFENGTALAKALAEAEPMRSAIEGLTDQRMLEQHGELIDPASIQAAANQAVHNEARARSLATELKAQADMLNPRQDTGQVNAAGSKITVNVIIEAAKQFAARIVAGTPLKDMKNKAWQHTAAERRAATAWQKATMAGDTAGAVKAKQDQVLNNAAAKAAMDAMGEAKKILEFFKRVVKDGNEKTVEKGRDPDVVNAARAVLAMYGVGVKQGKSAIEYMKLLETNDPLTYAAVQDSLRASIDNAQPLASLTMEQLQGLHEEIQSMWHLARRTRQMEVQGKLMDIDEAADELGARMAAIGVPLETPGTNSALTPAETRTRWLQFAGSILRRVEQWAEGMDGKYGGPFLKLVFGPVKAAADAYRTDKVVYRKAYQALLDAVAPSLRKGLIEAPELGYTFGKGHNGIGHAELLHAVLHTGNESNKRKLLLGRGWAVENADGTMDTAKWDAFIQRAHDTGLLGKVHYDFAQGVWDLLEQTKPLAQRAHRDVFGRYFAEVTADAFDTSFGNYRGGYVPAQADPRIVQDADLRALASLENESMSFSFPATNKGFTKGRVEYNRPLMLDLRTLAQHIDKVLLFAHMEVAVRDVNKLLSRKPVSQPLGKIDPTVYAGMLVPWLNRSARQVVETPIVGDGGISRVLSAARSRAGMALMFANISNTLQQVTGFAGAFAKLKADGMQSSMTKATALFISAPKKMSAAVAAASPFMSSRMDNEIAAMNDAMNAILLDPSLYERAQAWTMRHAYFLQSALDNTMGPIIWTSAYNGALGKGLSQDDAVRYADGVIRQTQGSTLPEDVSRIETGPAYARVFTQFIGYFNMMANTNGTQVKQIAQDVGLKRGAGKALMLVTLGMMVPIWVAEAIAQAMRGGPDDPEGDGWLDDWLAAVFGLGTIKGMFAMVPFVGSLANAAVNRFNGNPADDKMSLSPAVSLLEGAAGVPVDIYKTLHGEGNTQRTVRDVASLVSILTGLPAIAAARPLGYLAGVEGGQISPTSPADAVRGALTGTASPASKNK